MSLPDFLFDGPQKAPKTFAFAHGAGAPMDSDFMDYVAKGLAEQEIRVARFEFPYMAGRRTGGKKRPPDRMPILLDTWAAVIDHLGPKNLVIGGKSMGGRMAAHAAVAAEDDGAPVAGLICLGFPFHAPGKPDKVRLDAVDRIKTPTLILQGTRDPFGTAEQVPGYKLSQACKVRWLEDGEHSFKPRKSSGRTKEQNWDEAVAAMVGFIRA